MEKLDVLIVGAGVVGAALAYALRDSTAEVLVVEAEPGPGRGMSSRNSGVVHAGIYYPERSLKTRLCRRGNQLLHAFVKTYDLPFQATGKFLVANDDEEERYLDQLLAQNPAQGMVEHGNPPPNVRARRTVYSPSTAVVDSHSLIETLLEQSGKTVVYGQRVLTMKPDSRGVLVTCEGERLRVGHVFNCAGLHATNFCNHRTHYFAKGHYMRLIPPSGLELPALIYPAVSKQSTGLGIHLTRNLSGETYLGPDVAWIERPHYGVSAGRIPQFLAAARSYLPWLEPNMLSPGYAGIRAKLNRHEFSDFVFEKDGAITHCLGIESPGLTSALAIAEMLVDRFDNRLRPFAD